ncbi:MAG: malonyl-ACP O-methyltransferase BioC [Candidatus Omnitrophota bacterium]|nr:malonyl-ACP O-methyltransferase BioC [Candidatus Omnitrophota bacterium]
MNKKQLARNFSRCAPVYDKYANIQAFAAMELIRELPCGDCKRILEIGCGTGSYTRLLRERFKHAAIESVDIAEKMVELARQKLKDSEVKFSVEDAEKMKLDSGYDLVTSNAAIQWFESPGKAIRSYRKALNSGGILAFSVFGPLTFKELGNALGRVMTGHGLSVASRGFLSKEALEKMLAKFFRKVSVREALIKEELPCLAGLLEKIKYTGVRGLSLNSHFVWSRRLLRIIEDAYKKEYGRIIATYQVFLCKAII